MYSKSESVIDGLKFRICHRIGASLDEAEISISPLIWYVLNGRSSMDFNNALHNMTETQKNTVAKRLYKMRRGDYREIINNIKRYLKVEI